MATASFMILSPKTMANRFGSTRRWEKTARVDTGSVAETIAPSGRRRGGRETMCEVSVTVGVKVSLLDIEAIDVQGVNWAHRRAE